MLRTKLETKLDCLLGEKLQERHFLTALLDAYRDQAEQCSNRPGLDQSAIAAKLTELKAKKQRVLDAFFEGVIEKAERDRKLANVESEVDSYQRLLVEAVQPTQPTSAADLERVFEPFTEWEFLQREDKRSLLSMICLKSRFFNTPLNR
jgi:hypothetical protein